MFIQQRIEQLKKHLINSMSSTKSIFQEVPLAPPDVIFNLTASYNADTDTQKVNLGVGAYRDDNGKPWILPVVKKAEQIIINNSTLNHEYLPITGLKPFKEAAVRLILGENSPVIKENRIVSVQTISGTGANHLDVGDYVYYNPSTIGLDIDGLLQSLKSAQDGSIILLHACAHNPTGVDPTQEQWIMIADVMESKGHFPFFDCAYQGFASGDLDKDAWAVRYFIERGFELLICQSFAKNFGLYGQRAGCLTFVLKNADAAARVESQLAKLQRAEISNPPIHGARIVNTVLNDPALYTEWTENLKTMSYRIQEMRKRLYEKLIELNTPGTWNHITDQIGMFSYTGLKAQHVKMLKEKYHIYLVDNGRISMAGLNSSNVDYFAQAVDDVVRTVLRSLFMVKVVDTKYTSHRIVEKYSNEPCRLCYLIVYENLRESPVPNTPKFYEDLYKECWKFDRWERPTIEDVWDRLEASQEEDSN
ncbi:3213_t:CDS:10 [Entrophospora sp. SA101]|nr:3213_t:CDS:10 [Entrophospora sp. SA101]